MEEEDYYDEFGNYIGPSLEEEEEDDDDEVENEVDSRLRHVGKGDRYDEDDVSRTRDDDDDDDEKEEEEEDFEARHDRDDSGMSLMRYPQEVSARSQIVLHEDKKYYPSANEIYGEDVEVLVQEEDTQALTEPMIAPVKTKRHTIKERNVPLTMYKREFLIDMMGHPEFIRNIALVGHIHHGKTSFIDMLVKQTHWGVVNQMNDEKQLRYTDKTIMEKQRGISIKSTPMSFLLQDIREKSYVINVIDTPGHVDFVDETVAALRLCDGMVVIVDVIEGVTASIEYLIKMAAKEGLSIILVLNKMDRLILELKLPPNDAYFKIKHVIDEFNACVMTHFPEKTFSPAIGNVCFACSQLEWCFSLKSFAHVYSKLHKTEIDLEKFARNLWGDVFFNSKRGTFDNKTPEAKTTKRSFVEFILEPLYKLHAHVLGETPDTLKTCLAELNIYLKKKDYELNVKPLLTLVMKQFLGDVRGFIESIVQHVPSPVIHAKTKLERIYKGPVSTETSAAMIKCSSEGPLVIHVSKLYLSEDGKRFDALGRVMSGTVKTGQRVKVLGENYSLEDEEDMTICEVNNLWISQSQYRLEIPQATAGNWVLIGGIDESILKTATIVDEDAHESSYTFVPLKFHMRPVVRVGVEPLNPSELPKMLEGLRKLTKSYPIFQTKVEESGEHIILGTGEMYLDCVLHDLRTIYAEIEIKVADPVVTFCETVVETSSIKCSAETPNKRNTLVMIAEPLEKGLAEDIELGRISLSLEKQKLASFLEETYHWDILQSHHIWAFGPDDNGPNVLIDDTLPSEISKSSLRHVHDSVRQGFQWASREGPLCDEPMRNVKFRLVDATIAADPISRGSGQIIPTARRVCYSAFLTATPRIMEPVYAVEIQAPSSCISAIYTVLAKRRGHVIQDIPRPGTPLYTVKALLPVIDSFGFETDLRIQTQGLAFCQQFLDHWQMTPGDPLDKSLIVRPLEPSPASHLARDFMLKTRRRKGLGEDVAIVKYLDNPMLLSLAQQEFSTLNSNFL